MKNLDQVASKTPEALSTAKHSATPSATSSQQELDDQMVYLLGEVIRMSQAWVRALESGDPFTADKCEDQCIAAMEKFEYQRKKSRAQAESFEKTQ